MSTLQAADGSDAGVDGPAVDQHRAGAALTQAATEFGAIQRELAAQHVKERRRGIHFDLLRLGIDRQRDHLARVASQTEQPWCRRQDRKPISSKSKTSGCPTTALGR